MGQGCHHVCISVLAADCLRAIDGTSDEVTSFKPFGDFPQLVLAVGEEEYGRLKDVGTCSIESFHYGSWLVCFDWRSICIGIHFPCGMDSRCMVDDKPQFAGWHYQFSCEHIVFGDDGVMDELLPMPVEVVDDVDCSIGSLVAVGI